MENVHYWVRRFNFWTDLLELEDLHPEDELIARIGLLRCERMLSQLFLEHWLSTHRVREL